MKSVLFVDFDNAYSELRRLDQETADQFVRNPTVWMNWTDPVSGNARAGHAGRLAASASPWLLTG